MSNLDLQRFKTKKLGASKLTIPGYSPEDLKQNIGEEKGAVNTDETRDDHPTKETVQPVTGVTARPVETEIQAIIDPVKEIMAEHSEVQQKEAKEIVKTDMKGEKVPFLQFMEKLPAKNGVKTVPCVVNSNLQEELKMIAVENKTSMGAIHNQIILNWLNQYDGEIKSVRRALAKSRQ